ncbi:MAG: AsmA family protein [Bradyrhizobium sp.]|uniref:AsmA family protein n=1 Tax=Bradyrhizobium sp. TaxID=376 RepID=UPI001ED3289A|nr:AsmA family protein [Bradyrhizobium sp.]MBU6456134.1 AsmA family protein [Bradyrhizobium sp.]MDE2065861.1 AsmA family protein [Bradyrhizobium sp.]MDE2241609.1 AsmA family protein [Bradyrhizobium sp.]
MRALKIIGTAVAVLVAIAGLVSFIGIPSDFLTAAMRVRVERATGYRMTTAGTTTIGVWPSLHVTLNDVTLQDPRNRDRSSRLTIASLQADVTLSSLWSGHPDVTELVIDRPLLSVPLLRERDGPENTLAKGASSAAAEPGAISINRVRITDGTIAFFNLRDRVDDRIEGITADAVIDADRNVKINGNARASAHQLKFAINAAMPAPPIARQNIPFDLTLQAPGLLRDPLTAKAEARLNGSVVMINGLTGTLGDGAFSGWASADLSSKPLVKLDLDFRRLDVATSSTSAPPAAAAPWSNASINLGGLNYVDLQAKISAAEINFGQAHIAPAAIDATLTNGVLKGRVSNLGAYDGQANGDLIIDASASTPAFALSADLVGIRALPLLRSAADFDKLDGKLQAKLAVHSSGASQRAIMSNLDGTVFAVFRDGAIRGLNIAQMIRSLTSGTLSGWQENKQQATDLTQLSASFRIELGKATTSDINLVGPLVRVTGGGTVDLGEKSLALRVEPKLVMTTEGQGRATDPVGLGIPVVIEGPWDEPRIYPDIAGILDNPEAAYARLKEMGKGLFGPNGALGGLGGNLPSGNPPNANGPGSNGSAADGGLDQLGGNLGQTLGNLIQQGLRQGQTPAAPAPESDRR